MAALSAVMRATDGRRVEPRLAWCPTCGEDFFECVQIVSPLSITLNKLLLEWIE